MAETNPEDLSTAVDFLLQKLTPAEGELAPSSFASVERAVPGLSIARAGGTLAFTAEGLLQGMPFFLHARRGLATLELGPEPTEEPLYSASEKFTPLHGVVSPEEFREVLLALIVKLKPAPFSYEFRGHVVSIVHDDDGHLQLVPDAGESVFYAKGYSPEEALAHIAAPDPSLVDIGISFETQAEIFELQAIDPTPINEDGRVFPEPAPSFSVTL